MFDKLKYENVLHVLVNHANSSSKQSEKILANSILEHFEKIPNITIEKLAELCYVSQPTLTRFIKKLGYRNYNQFKSKVNILVNLIENETASDLFEVDDQLPIYSHYQSISSSLASTVERLDREQFKLVSQKIHDAKKIVILGIDYSQVVAFDAQLRFMRYEKVFETGVTCVEQINLVRSLKAGDVLVILSVSGVTNALTEVTKELAEGVECVIITSNNAPIILQDYSNVQIINISQESNQNTNTSQVGRFNLLFAIDVLYITYGQMYHSHTVDTS